MRKTLIVSVLLMTFVAAKAQQIQDPAARAWVDSIFKTLTPEQKIAQLMVIRMSGIENPGRRIVFYDSAVQAAVEKYNVGGVCLFQGGPQSQALRINRLQTLAKTPILFCIDGENGLGMRMDSVAGLPRQMMLGATGDPELIYSYGRLVGQQCKRIGIQVDYAPVVDINNNPDNPVINDRSFGEDKYKVAEYGVQYMKGLQSTGVMACAKHFPGHGDVSVDSHLDLPVISKDRAQLDSLELYPFRAMFNAGVGSVMIAHLYIPALDATPHRASSLSETTVTKLMRKKLHYQGLSFTDALEMKGVAKFYPDGEASVQSLAAGNDMLCLPGDVPLNITKIAQALADKKLSWKDIDARVKRVLYAKYQYGLAAWHPIDTSNLTRDLNAGIQEMRRKVAENALTLLRNADPTTFPILTGVDSPAYSHPATPFVPFSTPGTAVAAPVTGAPNSSPSATPSATPATPGTASGTPTPGVPGTPPPAPGTSTADTYASSPAFAAATKTASPASLRTAAKKIAYIGMGLANENEFSRRMRSDYNAHIYFFDYNLDSAKAQAALELLSHRYDALVIGLHGYNRFPAGNFAISRPAAWLLQQLETKNKAITFIFGNPYAIKNACEAPNLVACYEDDSVVHDVAADWLKGKFIAKGQLPVSVCPGFAAGNGITGPSRTLAAADPATLGLDPKRLQGIDSICREAISNRATPGCVVLVAKNGQIAYEKAFGYMSYDSIEPVYTSSLYDMASVTKICATTMGVMKLYDEGRLDLQKTLGDYLPWTRGTDKAGLKIFDILLHQARLVEFIPFYRETIDSTRQGSPRPGYYTATPDNLHSIRVAENMYLRNDYEDTLYRRILDSKLKPTVKYVYSDNDFIFMGKIVEAISGLPLDVYVKQTYYDPLGMTATGFRPRERFPLGRIAPTAFEPIFRQQQIRGDVHDPGAAMFGGVAGHAGLFSDAYGLAVLEQMLLNGGEMNGHRFLKKETIDFFTAYHSDISRRGIGFDKPEKDNATRKEPYPCLSASPATWGHTGFTGTCVWVDPKYNLIYVFLSNRVNPIENNPRLSNLSIRGRIQETIYQSMGLDTSSKSKSPHLTDKTKRRKKK